MIHTSSARTTALGTQTDNPFVAWDNLAASATLGGTATLTDGDASNAVTGDTFSYWLPNVTATTASFQVTFGAARTLSCIAMAAHNLSDLGGSVVVQRSTDAGATWASVSIGAVTPTDNSPIIFRMATTGQDAADWRLRFTGLTAGDDLYVGVAFFGDDLVIPMRLYQGFAPILTPTEVALQSNVSVGGNYLGSSVVTRGSTISMPISKVDPTFVRGAFLPFVTAFNSGTPFFTGWRPATYAQDAHYAWRSGGGLRPANGETLNLMDFTIQAQVFEP